MASQPVLERKRELVRIARHVHRQGLAAATDGNLSIRGSRETIWITPTGGCLAELATRDLVCIDLGGKILKGRRPSSEFALHLAVYRHRPDVNAVLHAHPPLTTAFSFAGRSDLLARNVLPEVFLTFGSLPTTRYATPSSAEGPEAIRELIVDHDALVLDRHGSLTVGKTMVEAFRKLEKMEHMAKVLLAATQLGELRELSPDEMKRLGALQL